MASALRLSRATAKAIVKLHFPVFKSFFVFVGVFLQFFCCAMTKKKTAKTNSLHRNCGKLKLRIQLQIPTVEIPARGVTRDSTGQLFRDGYSKWLGLNNSFKNLDFSPNQKSVIFTNPSAQRFPVPSSAAAWKIIS